MDCVSRLLWNSSVMAKNGKYISQISDLCYSWSIIQWKWERETESHPISIGSYRESSPCERDPWMLWPPSVPGLGCEAALGSGLSPELALPSEPRAGHCVGPSWPTKPSLHTFQEQGCSCSQLWWIWPSCSALEPSIHKERSVPNPLHLPGLVPQNRWNIFPQTNLEEPSMNNWGTVQAPLPFPGGNIRVS